MMTKHRKKDYLFAMNNKEKIVIGLGSICILLFAVFLAFKIDFMGSAPDELGYLSTSAKLSNWKWDEAFQNYPFYGVGAGIVWSPLFLFFNNFQIVYKGIIFLNGCFLVLSYWISYLCAKKIFKEMNCNILSFVCLCVTFYTSNVFYAQDALSETLLYLLFWCSFYCVLMLIEKDKYIYYLLLAVVESFMIIVHLRTMVIMIATSVFLIIISLIKSKEKRWKKISTFFLVILLGIIIVNIIQKSYVANSVSAINAVNTGVNAIEEIKKIFINIPAFMKGILGEIFAFSVSGNIVFFSWLYFSICEVKNVIKNSKFNVLQSVNLYLLITVVCCLGAYATNKTTLARLDTIVYLRYMENIIGPILVLGCIWLLTKSKQINITFICLYVAVILIGAQVVLRSMELAETNIFDTSSSVVIGSYFEYFVENVDNSYTLLKIITVVLILTFGILWILKNNIFRKDNTASVYLVGILLFAYWGYCSCEATNIQLSMKSECYTNYNEVIIQAKEKSITQFAYWKNDIENSDLKRAKYLQAMIGKNRLDIISEEEIKKIDEGLKSTFLLTDSGDGISEDLVSKGYRLVFSNSVFDGYIFNE